MVRSSLQIIMANIAFRRKLHVFQLNSTTLRLIQQLALGHFWQRKRSASRHPTSKDPESSHSVSDVLRAAEIVAIESWMALIVTARTMHLHVANQRSVTIITRPWRWPSWDVSFRYQCKWHNPDSNHKVKGHVLCTMNTSLHVSRSFLLGLFVAIPLGCDI